MNYIMIEDLGIVTVEKLNDVELAKKFSENQIEMLQERKIIICNNHHGNSWVNGRNATACDMVAVSSEHMNTKGLLKIV